MDCPGRAEAVLAALRAPVGVAEAVLAALGTLAVDAGVATLGEAHVVAAPVAGVPEAVLALLGALAAELSPLVNCVSTLPASPDLLKLPFTPLAPLLSTLSCHPS